MNGKTLILFSIWILVLSIIVWIIYAIYYFVEKNKSPNKTVEKILLISGIVTSSLFLVLLIVGIVMESIKTSKHDKFLETFSE